MSIQALVILDRHMRIKICLTACTPILQWREGK